ncbi:hypothetical protein MPER_11937 [Moniliophthora perniciosa FA553]|nr:hypothetical protein MPER_11937 [Moniliophthora perniciosa FA553]
MPQCANLQYLKFDLSKKETSGFVEMLKAFISRMLMDDKEISTITADLSSEEAKKIIHALKEKADSLYSKLLFSAIEFCNKDLGNRKRETKGRKKEPDDVRLCQTMKESIRKYCNASTETTRYKQLVSVLNTILCNFRSHEFKDMIIPAEMGDSELIFITNDSAVIKTDVTAVLKIQRATRGQNGGLKLTRGQTPHAGLDQEWLNVYQPWDLKMVKKRLQPERFGKVYSGQDLTAAAPGDDQVTDTAGEKESKQAGNGSCTRSVFF